MQRGVEVRAAGAHGSSRELHSPVVSGAITAKRPVEACCGRNVSRSPTRARIHVQLCASVVVEVKIVIAGFRS